MRPTDETGNTYGRLTVLCRTQPQDKELRTDTNAYWLCRCECEKTIIVSGNNLRRGKVQSCGCLRREQAPKNAQKKKETVI